MDEISTGLDSSTTFLIVNAIRQYIHILKGTAVISLLQLPPETYSLFDDIILLSDGQIVHQGPCENVLEFFSYMGFECPKRKAVADFLQEVTSKKDQGQYWGCKDKPYSFVTVKDLVRHSSHFILDTGCLKNSKFHMIKARATQCCKLAMTLGTDCIIVTLQYCVIASVCNIVSCTSLRGSMVICEC
ncbi:hypothetical protein Droror1_Dr00015119 [Drosera rotundifolia]